METYVVTIAFFGVLMLMMAVGVIFSNKPLKGSCGGVGGNCPCAEAGTPGACKIELDDDDDVHESKTKMSATKGEDGLIRYS